MRLDATREPTTSEVRWSLYVIPAAAVLSAVVAYITAVQPVLIVTPIFLAVPVIIWRRPYYAVLFLLGTALLIENFVYKIGPHKGAVTASIPWWRSFSHGMILFPVEIFLIVVLLIWVLKAGLERTFGLPKSPVVMCLKVYWVLLFLAVGIGLSHGAKLKFDLWEVRSWIYLSIAYLLAAALLRTMRALDLVLWTIVIGTGLKGIQGTYIFFSFARALDPRPEAILGHEEAFFFGVFIALTCALWLYDMRGPLRRVATGLLPCVVIADLANARRTAWLIIAISVLTLMLICFRTLPHRRKFVTRALFILLIGSALYLPVYWNHDGTLAQPARAVRSQFGKADPRDQASNLYRQQENLNLIIDIKGSGILGSGFGIPIAYTSQIVDISTIDPMIAFIPHNGLLWIWLRLGLQGEIAFWCIFSVSLVRACRLAMVKDRRLAMLGTVVACAIVSYLVDGHEDVGLGELRIAVAMGCLLGLMEAGLRLARAQQDRILQDSSSDPVLVAVAKQPD
jgi:hypothetical protein